MYRPLTARLSQCLEQGRELSLANVRHREARIRVLGPAGCEPGRFEVGQDTLRVPSRDVHFVRRVPRFQAGGCADGCMSAMRVGAGSGGLGPRGRCLVLAAVLVQRNTVPSEPNHDAGDAGDSPRSLDAMIPTRSASASTSSILCVVMRTARSLVNARSVPHASRLLKGSTPEENSSISTTGRSPKSASARDSLRWLPPERLLANSSALAVSPAPARRTLMSRFNAVDGTPLRRP